MEKRLERIINARLLYVCNDYIDYNYDRRIGRCKTKVRGHKFAKIDKADFPKFIEKGQEHDGFLILMDKLEVAIKDDARISLVIERRGIPMEHANPKDKSKKKTQKMDFLIKVEWTLCGEGE